MADVTTRFKLETTQFDSPLRNSTQKLKELIDLVGNAGGDFNVLSEKSKALAGSFGTLSDGAKNAKDSLKELVANYNEMAKAYNTMSKDMQQSDVGKAIAGQMSVLQDRISQAKKELYDMDGQMRSTGQASGQLGDFLNQLAGKFGINIGMLSKFGGALALVSGALKVGTDAFKTNASSMDEWDRAVASAQSAYDTFLYALNNGDFSGFFSRIGAAIQKAREAADAINNLEVNSGIRNTDRMRIQSEQTRLRAIIKRQGANSPEGQAAQQQLLALEPKLSNAYRRESGDNWIAARDIIDLTLLKSGLAGQISAKDISKLFYDESAFSQFKRGAAGEKKARQQGMQAGFAGWDDTRNLNQKVLDAFFTKEVRGQIEPYLRGAFGALNSSYGVGMGNNSYLKEPKPTGGKTVSGANTADERELVGLIEIQEEKIKSLQKAMKEATSVEDIKKYSEAIKEATQELDILTGKVVKISVDSVLPDQGKIGEGLAGKLSSQLLGPILSTDTGIGKVNELKALEDSLVRLTEAQKEFGGESSEIWAFFQKQIDAVQSGIDDFKGGSGKSQKQKSQSPTEVAGKLVSNVSSIASGIEQLGLQLPEDIQKGLGMLQGVITILSGISSLIAITTAIQGAKSVPIVGALLAHAAVVHAAGGYKVPGNYMSGDRVPAMLNSGELVLNTAESNILASKLSGAAYYNNMHLTATISGEQIRLALNNNSRRRGRGEYLTTKTIR